MPSSLARCPRTGFGAPVSISPPNGEANVKWKIRLARDMAQEALVVIEAPSSEEAEAILWA